MATLALEEKACLKHKLLLEEALVALMFRQVSNPKALVDNLLNREVLILKDGKYSVTQHWSKELDAILAESSKEQSEERLRNLAIEMRKLYPEGRMLDKRTGTLTTYYFKCNVSEVAKKLKTFFARYGDFSDEEILDATKRYVASYNGNYQTRGFRLIKYFIFKDDVKQGPDGNYVEPLSPLLDFLENKEEEPAVVDNSSWTTKLI